MLHAGNSHSLKVFLRIIGGYNSIYTQRCARKYNYKHISMTKNVIIQLMKSSGFKLDEWKLDKFRLQHSSNINVFEFRFGKPLSTPTMNPTDTAPFAPPYLSVVPDVVAPPPTVPVCRP